MILMHELVLSACLVANEYIGFEFTKPVVIFARAAPLQYHYFIHAYTAIDAYSIHTFAVNSKSGPYSFLFNQLTVGHYTKHPVS